MKPTIGARILLGFGLVLALALGLGVYALYTMAEIREIQKDVTDRDFAILDTFRELALIQGATRGYRDRAVIQYFLLKDKLSEQEPRAFQAQWRQAAERTDQLLTELQTTVAEYEKDAVTSRRKEQLTKLRQNTRDALAAWKEAVTEVEALFSVLDRADPKDLVSRLENANRVRQAFDSKLATGVQLTVEQVGIGNDVSTATYESARLSTILGLVILLTVGLVGCFFIQRSIAVPLTAFMGFVDRVGQGDLTHQAGESQVGELDQLGRSLNGMVAGLKDVAGQTLTVTQNLNAATAQIMAAIQEQAASTREQAATVQEITTTMEEISQSGAQIGARAKQVAASAEATSVASNSGIQAVQETTRTMGAIREQVEEVAENIVALSEKTQAVGEIIATVNDIAERSNLLALNAAIEAAAAGDQGNRFSVVANEMKDLADQAKDSTVQVRTILGEIQKGINTSVMLTEEAVKRVESGKQQADVTEQTIRQMARTTLESVQAFEQIISGGNQQQIGFEQVAQGMKDIRQAVGQTAAATSQLERAVTNLNALSLELKQAVGRYRL